MPLLQANGAQLFYDQDGPWNLPGDSPGDAPVVVFSNSIGTTLEMWDAQARALAGRYRVLRYDTRGHGRSPVAAGPASIETLADDLAGLLDSLGVARAHVVGLSLGGMTAQSLAVRRPELVASLVLMATSAHLPGNWKERAATVLDRGMGAVVEAAIPRWFTPAFIEGSPGQVAKLREAFLKIDPRGYAACCHAIAAMDLREGNASIAAPTLILAGADDPATPVAMMEEIRATIPDAELVVLSRAAHILAVERAELVNRHLLAFLDSLPDAPPDRASSVTGAVRFEAGLANRKSVLGAEHVQRSLDKAGRFGMPWQDFITRTAWGEVWGDPSIPWPSRSMVTLAMMVALNREEEFKLHVRPALRNGVTVAQLRSLLMQTAVYAGVPAANGAFRWVKDVLGDELEAGS